MELERTGEEFISDAGVHRTIAKTITGQKSQMCSSNTRETWRSARLIP
jgi:hypothetical protein